jgi:hypothetical protein
MPLWKDVPTYPEWVKASETFRARFSNKIWLKELDTWVRRYHFSGRPIDSLRKLNQAIDDWFNEPFDHLKEPDMVLARLDLSVVVTKKLSELNRLSKGYKSVVCVAYETKIRSKLGSSDDATDIAERWEQMQSAIRLAQTTYTNKLKKTGREAEDKERLKIFMAPEFYFRGRSGAYDMARHFPDFLDKIPDFTQAYPDWLFVLGTFVCSWKGSEKVDIPLLTSLFGVRRSVSTGTMENYALVQKGGFAGRDHLHDVQVGKEFPSHLDFEHDEAKIDWYADKRKAKVLGSTRPVEEPPGARDDPGTQGKRNLAQAGATQEDEATAFGCIFTLDRIMFGLEVCRDHYMGRLAHAKDKAGVKVQLIPSWGCTIQTGAGDGRGKTNNCLPNTIVFNVDGARGDSEVLNTSLIPVGEYVSSTFTQKGKYFPPQGKIKIYKPVGLP